jgi:hypothetical protein
MPAPLLTREQLEEVHRRATSGESVVTLAEEYGVHYPNLMKRLYRWYGYRGDWRKPGIFNPPTDPIEIGYLAGLFDGEGSVFPTQRFFGWQVRITMTNEEVMRWLHSLGGALSYSENKPPRLPTWTWALNRYEDVPRFCETMLPYLKVKRARVEECIAHYRSSPPLTPGRKPKVARMNRYAKAETPYAGSLNTETRTKMSESAKRRWEREMGKAT